MLNYHNPNIDYTEYKMRLCSYNWEYCDGKCNSCAKRNTYTTNTTIPEVYNTKKYNYTVDYVHKDSLTIPNNYDNNYTGRSSSITINGIDENLYCQIIGPWSYYREQYGWKGDLL